MSNPLASRDAVPEPRASLPAGPSPTGTRNGGGAGQRGSLTAVVIGGGVLAMSTAFHLVRRGVSVWLVAEAGLASGASGRSLSWLNSAAIRSAEYHRLRTLGIDRYRTLAAREPGLPWLRFDGGLMWGTAEEETRLRTVFAYENAEGYAAEWVTAEEIPSLTPGVDTSSVPAYGAIFNPGEGWVDLPSLIDLLAKDFAEAGGEVVLDAGAATVTTSGGKVTGVRTASGLTLRADAVVLATGSAVPAELARLGAPIGDRTPIALLVRTRPVGTALRSVLNTPRVSVRPTPDGALVLDSGWSEEAVVRHEDGTFDIPETVVPQLLAEASAVLAGNPRLSPDSCGAGPKPIPADGEPVLGALDQLPGLHVAFTHSGATLGLIAGELVADEIVSGRPHPLLATFSPNRFLR